MPKPQPIVLTGHSAEHEDDCACPDRAFDLTFDAVGNDVETDCACATNVPLFTRPIDSGSDFVQTTHVHTQVLAEDFHLIFSPYAPSGPSVLNATAWTRWQSFTAPQPLVEEVDWTLAAQHLLCPQGTLPVAHSARPETLTAWLHITNACNLDCPYCYVRKSSARMSEETGRRAIESLFRSAQLHGFKAVKLKYAGGEATLHFDLVRSLHEYARELSHEAGLDLREVLLSNGVRLRADDAEWLLANGVKLMISIDGIGDLHNQLRPQRGGGETFDRVEHTIDRVLLPRGLRPDITTTVTRLNAGGVADVVKWAMIERDLPLSLNFYRQNILSASRADLALEESVIIEGMLNAYALIEEHLPIRPFLNSLLDRVQAEAHSHTCGVGQSYVVITHTGQIAQCQMHLDTPLVSAFDGDLIPLVASGPLQNVSVDQKEGCRECEYRYRCSGGCPLETYRTTGRWDVQSPNCHIYKTLLPEALRLEGLRLLKVHGYLN
jgi:uncharacterized protein